MGNKDIFSDQNMEEWLNDNSMEAMDTAAQILQLQHETALELTKLILQHTKEEKITKESIFSTFEEAIDRVMKHLN
ncbi:hypothetical protein BH10PSE19_BH10PSE19_22560 [soil metagenome]